MKWLRKKFTSPVEKTKQTSIPRVENLESRLLLSASPVIDAMNLTPSPAEEGQVVELSVDFTGTTSTSEWTTPEAITGFVGTGVDEYTPFVTSEGMYYTHGSTIYFAEYVPGVGDTPGTYQNPQDLGLGANTSAPWVSEDTGHMYYYYGSGSTRRIKVAVREGDDWLDSNSSTEAAALEAQLFNINTLGIGGENVAHPSLTADENTIVFSYEDQVTKEWKLCISNRQLNGTFESSQTEENLNAMNNINALSGKKWFPNISSDGLSLYFSRDTEEIFVVTRASRTADFGTPELILGSSTDPFSMPSLASDGSLYVAQKVSTWGIYQSQPINNTVNHTADIDWDGDGVVDQTIENVDSSFQVTHVYDDNGSYDVSVTITDSLSNSDSETISAFSVANVDPTVTITNVPEVTVYEGDSFTLGSIATDQGTADIPTLSYSWSVMKDGAPLDIDVEAGTEFTFTPPDNGIYHITLTVNDKDGGEGSETVILAVANADPVVEITGVPSIVKEGDSVILNSIVTDAGVLDVSSLKYAWSVLAADDTEVATGDGTEVTFVPGDNGDYVVTLIVTDKDGGIGEATTTITVQNIAPVLVTKNMTSDAVNSSMVVNGRFEDAGTLDTHTVTLDWGDGTTSAAVVDQAAGTFSGDHVYQEGGVYVVTITVADDDTGIATSPVGTIIVGTDASEKITVRYDENPDLLKVAIRKMDSCSTDIHYISKDIGSIHVYALGGDDMIAISHYIDHETYLYGGLGDDLIYGGRGVDNIDGGAGNDCLFGRAGNDIIMGGAGFDRLWGNYGDDELDGGDDNDKLIGGQGYDILRGGSGNDYIWGCANDDRIFGGDGDDVLIGGAGDDYISGDEGNDWLDGGLGNDTIIGGDGNDILLGGAGADTLIGEDGNDIIFGGSGDDEIDGGNGDDIIFGGPGSDTIDGGDGYDIIIDGWRWCW